MRILDSSGRDAPFTSIVDPQRDPRQMPMRPPDGAGPPFPFEVD
jgi:hypothetical protein